MELTSAYQQLATLTQGVYTKEELLAIARQLSANAQGNVTVLYSGIVNGVSSSKIANAMKTDPNIRIINNTDIAKFLDSNEFLDALGATKGLTLDEMRGAVSLSAEKQILKDEIVKNWLFEPKTGAWAEASQRFVAATTGEVRILTEVPDATRTLYQVEIPELIKRLQSGAVTKVDGVITSDLLKLGTGEALTNTIFNNAGTQTIFSKPTVSNFNDYKNLTPESLASHMEGATPDQLARWQHNLSTFEVPHSAARILNKLGPIGALLGFGFATANASAAEAHGDTAGAKQIMIDYSVDTGGSLAGELAAGALAGLGTVALVAAGIITAPVAGAIVIGAALLGGFFGGDAAKELYESLKDRDDNGRSDLLDKLGNLIFGADYTITSPLPPELVGKTATIDATFSREQMVEMAKQDISWRYALRELNPFVVTGLSYENFNTDKSLDLYNEDTGEGAMTDLYLADRAAMLTWKIRFDTGMLDENDVPHTGVKPYNQDWDTSKVQGNWDFVDLSTKLAGGDSLTLAVDGVGVTQYDHQIVFGTKAADTMEGSGDSDHLYGMGGGDTLNGGDGSDWLEGNAGQDNLNGGTGNDSLFGGADVDILNGGEGNDILKGGAGVDVYQFEGSYGIDVISDTDGQGFITIDNTPANSGTLKLQNIYTNTAGYTFTKLNDGKSIVISKENDPNRIIINDWSESKNVSLNLAGEMPASPAVTLAGDFKKKIDGHGTAVTSDDTYVIVDNNYVDDGAQAGAQDLLYGNDSNNVIDGGGGDDFITGEAGDDYLIGGAGNDLIQGGLGNDTIIGGAGNDTLYAVTKIAHSKVSDVNYVIPSSPYTHTSAEGLNWVDGYNNVFENGVPDGFITTWSGQIINDYTGDNVTNFIDGGADDDYVGGGQGTDYLLGGTGKDFIQGALGSDIILGGDDNDYVDGDQGFADVNDGNDIIDGGNGDDILHGDGGDDIIFGGADNDKLWGEAGNDFLYGGAGNDQLAGGSENDYLEGGAGKDKLYGGDGDDVLIGSGDGDELFGGAGADTIYVGNTDTYSTQDKNDKIIFLSGGNADTASASLNPSVSSGGAGVTLNLGNAILNIGDGVVAQDDSTITFADGSQIQQSELLGTKLNAVVNIASESGDLFGGMLNDNLLATGNINSTLFGGLGNDTLTGNAGSNKLLGGEGNDNLNGDVGNDTLIGGAGNDRYVFNKGDGEDTIFDSKSDSNTIYFGAGITAKDIKLRLGSLLLDLGNGDQIHIQDFNQNDALNSSVISRFEFSDGSVLSAGEILSKGFDLDGSAAAETIVGTNTIDRIKCYEGNDTLIGGLGDDDLEGGLGNDTYQFNLGDGQDVISDTQGMNTIEFGANITQQDLHVSQFQGDDGSYYLKVQYGSLGDSIVIQDGLTGSIQSYQFSDGSSISHADLIGNTGVLFDVHGSSNADTLYGTANDNIFYAGAGNDQLYGLSGNDTLYGEVGEDTLNGGDGDDELDGGAGSDALNAGNGDDWLDGGTGNDILIGAAGQDSFSMYWGMGKDAAIDGIGTEINTVQLDSGITLSDLDSKREGNDLFINFKATNEGIVLKDYYAGNQQWQISDENGLITTIPEFLALSDNSSGIEKQFNNYQTSIKALYYSSLGADGFRMQSDGIFYKTTTEVINNPHYSSVTIRNESSDFDTYTLLSDETNISGFYQKVTSDFQQLYYNVNYTPVFSGSGSGTALSGSSGGSGIVSVFIPNGVNSGQINQGIGGLPSNSIQTSNGVWLLFGSSQHSSGGGSANITNVTVNASYQYHTTLTLEKIVGGDSDNFIKYSKDAYGGLAGLRSSIIVDGGAGNDIIFSEYEGSLDTYSAYDGPNFYSPGSETNNYGALLYGNAGDDTIDGSRENDTIIGGDNWDVMNGHLGADTYLINAEDTGTDIINDTASLSFYSFFTGTGYANWYYHSLGINDWQPQAEAEYFSGIKTLPSLPVISALDYLALAPLYTAGVIEKDTVEFGYGINLADLNLSWGYGTLNISWGEDKGVQIVMPVADLYGDGNTHPLNEIGNEEDWRLGAGIEQFKFADGTIVSMADMIANLAPIPNSTPIRFSVGDGSVVKSAEWVNTIVLGETITAENIKLSHDGYDLLLTLANGVDQLRIENWYEDQQNYPKIKAFFVESMKKLSSESLTYLGLDVLGTNVNETLTSGAGLENRFYGFDGNDIIIGGSGNEYLDGGNGSDTLIGGAGDDSYTVDSEADVVIENVNNGHDIVESSITFTLSANVEDLYLRGLEAINGTGNDLDNFIYGNDASNILNGGAGNDVLDGSLGDDTLIGGAGNDTYDFYYNNANTIRSGHDVIKELGQVASDTDVINLHDVLPTDVVLQKTQDDLVIVHGSESITITDWYLANSNTIEKINFNYLTVDANGYYVNIVESWDKATISANAPASNHTPDVATQIATQKALEDSHFTFTIPANAFSDVDVGDTLSYSTTLADGSALPSWLSFDAVTNTFSGTPLNEHVGSLSLTLTATDLAGTSVSQNFDLSVQNINDAPTLNLALADAVTTETQVFSYTIPANTFSDVDAGDVLSYAVTQTNGAALPSWLTFDAATRTISGTALDANIGALDLRVTATDMAGTSAQDNFLLTIKPLDRVLTGTAANDTLIGGQGNDVLDGGVGADIMKGGKGNDTYIVDNLTDVVSENLNEGIDTVQSSVTYLLTANIENLTLNGNIAINGVGNTLDNILIGNAANNTLNGAAGADTMSGGLGNDIYIVDNVGDVVIENAGEGTDTVQSSITYSLGNALENLTLTGTTAINGTGNELNNSLVGNTAANILTGGLGNDTLNGGAGADTMIGGLGNDIYVVDNVGDVVTENAGEGTDTVQSSVTYTLGAELENLTLTGTSAINGIGNAFDNLLTGNNANNTLIGGDGNDTLNGGTGADTMIGGVGNDTYVVENINDILIENADEGHDIVQTSITLAGLADNIEDIALTGTAAINAVGNGLNNTMVGNAAANRLEGGDGADTINGGAGADTMIGGNDNDIYMVDNVNDIVIEEVNGGDYDWLQTSVTLSSLAANVEVLSITGTVINATGNELDNIIFGNSNNNVIDGGLGADAMMGGSGNDTYIVDNINDIAMESAASGTDNVLSSITYTLTDNLENLTLTGTSAINGTGNTLNNVITGNSAANILDGGAGTDTLKGGAGDDTYIVDLTATNTLQDTVTEVAAEGVDTLVLRGGSVLATAATITLGTELDNLDASSTGATVLLNLTGNTLSNFMKGNAANNTLTDTAGGNDILQGFAGSDTFNDTVGSNLFDGGLGNDIITAGAGRDILIGGQGNDTITTGTGYDVIVFNKGDGQDIINASTGADNTISLGGNFAYSDLSLTKSTTDLILKMGATDQITLKDWYLTSPTNKSVINLQVVAEAIQGFTLGGADALRNNKIENFNFSNLVAAFDTAGATANWQLTDARLTTHLQAGSDTAAIGGDLAYQYGKNSNLTGMGLLNAQSVIAAASFGQTAQTLNNPTVWQAEVAKLG